MTDLPVIWPAGMKKTKPREYVMTVLDQAQSPLSAADIYTAIERMGAVVSLSTIYRILELFVQKDIVIKITMADNDMAIYALKRYQHKHYAVCVNCHKVVPMDNCPMDQFIPQLTDDEFYVVGHRVELYGYCKNCSQKKKQGK